MKFMIAIAAFSLIVLVHELGHFLAARYFKVKVKNFSVGLGPILLSFSSGDTLFCLRAVPLGGFVDIDGMEEDSRFGFNIRPYYQKVPILFAGVFMNIILSFVAMFSISMYLGHIDETSNIITRSLSSEAILKVDDKVVEVNGKKIDNWREFEDKIGDSEQKFVVKVIREGKEKEIEIKPEERVNLLFFSVPAKRSIYLSLKKASKAIVMGFIRSSNVITRVLQKKIRVEELSGPIGIMKTMADSSSQSMINIFILISMISIGIAFFNLLPIPPLDGGKIFLVTLDRLGIKLSKKLKDLISAIGVILFLVLTIIVGKSDINKIRKESANSSSKR